MSKISAFISLTLDGVMQAPGRPDEDRRGGFEHGGWATPYSDPVLGRIAAEGMSKDGALLFGRRTYEGFADVWPKMPKPNPFSDVLERTHKYVASTTLKEPLPWANSTILGGDAADAVADLKKESDQDLVILGSGVLVRSLLEHDLIDEFVLPIHPLVLGSGQHLFVDGGQLARFKLVDSKTTTKGVMVATYQLDPERPGGPPRAT
jgi:dihydrofolate reductase